VYDGGETRFVPSFPIVVFALLCAFIGYTVAGYPLILGWLARRFAKPVTKRFEPRTVSFVIAVHNGENFLADKLRSILDLHYPRELMEIVVVSDASTDSTDEIARAFGREGVKLIRVPRGGKPAALNACVPQTSGEILILTDVRQTLEPDSVARLIACFADPAVGVVSGDLVIRRGNVEETNVGLYWRYERWIRKQLGRVDSMMGATGPFYAIRRDLFRPMPADLLLDDMYVPLGAFFQGFRLIVEEEARAFDYPTGVETEFRRKIRTLAGNYQLLRYFPQLLTPRNRMLFHYLSYKMARLLLPWAVIALFFVSFGLPYPGREIAIALQLLFYALAVTDLLVGPEAAWKRLSSPARTVVSMLAATACAVAIFFVPAQKLWKPTQLPGVRKL
jgi:cellulose synthase/poly-beta-1,6-N-acetylglucosamine synthase-like glycosyltransferase